MGGEQSTAYRTELYQKGTYTLIEHQKDDRYGPINMLQNNETGQLACEIVQNINNEQLFDQKVQHCNGRRQLSHQNLVDFLSYSAEKKDEFCSTFWKISMLYEYLNSDLKEQIAVRQANNLRYREGELWYLLISIVNGLYYLKQQEIIHGDIRPSQILLTRDGRVKLGENFYQQIPLNAYQQFLMNTRTAEFYIAPTLFEALKEGNPQLQYDVGANDVFSLGMTLLEASLLQNTDICYDAENYQFSCGKLQELLYQLQTLYSPRYHSIVSQMLKEDDNERPSLEDLKEELDKLATDEVFTKEMDQYLRIVEGAAVQEPVVEQQQQEVVVEEVIQQQPQQVVEEVVVQQQPPVEQQQQVVYQSYVPQQQQQSQVVYQSAQYDLRDIDDRIARVLAQSRETVKRYGGEKVYQAYENYENSKGFEPVRNSQVGRTDIYTPNQEYVTRVTERRVVENQQQPSATTEVRRVVEPATTTEVRRVVEPATNTEVRRVVEQPVETVKRSHHHHHHEQQATSSPRKEESNVQQTVTSSYQPTTSVRRVVKEGSDSGVRSSVTRVYQGSSYGGASNNNNTTTSVRRVVAGTSYQPSTTTYTQKVEEVVDGQVRKVSNDELDKQIKSSYEKSQQIEQLISQTKQAAQN